MGIFSHQTYLEILVKFHVHLTKFDCIFNAQRIGMHLLITS
ncbi:hypothetical protein T11_18615 [Trichinella zimbabwensis]|uniref:Uncharacterized protein n=1 Tax=Trichinella zimbabwensis TaxID=268475 RepID=A0A0V1GCK0_9BILA|nr:hypothetical protein T11_18615 [Trichinella zimbabwensis]